MRQEKEVKGIWIGKETVKLSWSGHDMMKYVENYKDGTKKKLLQLIDGFSEIAGYEINTHRLLHLYTLTVDCQREK